MKRHAPFTRGINASPSRLKSLAGYNRLLEKQQAGIDRISWQLHAQKLTNEILTVSQQAMTMVRLEDAEFAIVKSVPDGDGLKLSDRRRVRYLGIDAPEVANHGRPAEPFAHKAKALNEQLVRGKGVLLQGDASDTDRYGRLLRYVFVQGLFVNAILLVTGFARLKARNGDSNFVALLGLCEALANENKVGIWR